MLLKMIILSEVTEIKKGKYKAHFIRKNLDLRLLKCPRMYSSWV